MSVNDDYLDKQVAHSIGLRRLASGITAKIVGIIEDSDVEIDALLDELPETRPTWPKIDAVLRKIEKANDDAYKRILDLLTAEIEGLSRYEIGYQRDVTIAVLPREVKRKIRPNYPDPDDVTKAAYAGYTVSEYVEGMKQGRYRRYVKAVREAYSGGSGNALDRIQSLVA